MAEGISEDSVFGEAGRGGEGTGGKCQGDIGLKGRRRKEILDKIRKEIGLEK